MGAAAGAIDMAFAALQGGMEQQAAFEEFGAETKKNAYNKSLTQLAERDALAKGNYEAGMQRIAGAQLAAKQKVAYANSGVDTTVGTPAEVIASTEQFSEMDAQQIQNNAAREAWGYREKGKQIDDEQRLAGGRLRRREAQTFLTSAAGILKGAAGGAEGSQRAKKGK